MLGLGRLRYFVGLAAVVGVLAASWALVYFFPSPPSKITIATATGGSTYELLGNRYKAILARSHVDVAVRLTNGAAENLRLLQDKNSGVAAGIVAGGVSDAGLSPDLRDSPRLAIVRFGPLPPKADSQRLHNAPSHTIYQHLRGNRCQALPHAPFETRPPAPSLWPVLGRMDPIGVARRKNRPHKDHMECRSASEDGSENPRRDSTSSADPG